MKKITVLTFVLAILAGIASSTFAQEQAANLIKNPTFSANDAGAVANWQLPTYSLANDPSVVSKLKWGVQNIEGAPALFISNKETVKANVWWEQLLPASGGGTYEISVKAKGALEPGSKYGDIHIGVHFLGEQGKWLGYQEISSVAPSMNWQTVKGKVTVPDDALKMGLRLSVIFDGQIQAFFTEPSLVEITK